MAEKYIECDLCGCSESEWYDEDCESHYYKCYKCGGTTNLWKEEIGFLSTSKVEISEVNIEEEDIERNYTKYYVVANVEIQDSDLDIEEIEYAMYIENTDNEYNVIDIWRREEDSKDYEEDFDANLLEDEDFQKYTIEALKDEIL